MPNIIKHPYPQVCHAAVTGRGGMDAVPYPVAGAWLLGDELGKHAVEWQECSVVVVSDAFCDCCQLTYHTVILGIVG